MTGRAGAKGPLRRPGFWPACFAAGFFVFHALVPCWEVDLGEAGSLVVRSSWWSPVPVPDGAEARLSWFWLIMSTLPFAAIMVYAWRIPVRRGS